MMPNPPSADRPLKRPADELHLYAEILSSTPGKQ